MNKPKLTIEEISQGLRDLLGTTVQYKDKNENWVDYVVDQYTYYSKNVWRTKPVESQPQPKHTRYVLVENIQARTYVRFTGSPDRHYAVVGRNTTKQTLEIYQYGTDTVKRLAEVGAEWCSNGQQWHKFTLEDLQQLD